MQAVEKLIKAFQNLTQKQTKLKLKHGLLMKNQIFINNTKMLIKVPLIILRYLKMLEELVV
jgi:hypothetical protein